MSSFAHPSTSPSHLSAFPAPAWAAFIQDDALHMHSFFARLLRLRLHAMEEGAELIDLAHASVSLVQREREQEEDAIGGAK